MPPLNPLKVFAVVSRSHNLTLASKELNVTQSAISRQIGVLESYLGIKLLNRERQGVTLTDQGRSYADQIVPAFETIATATESIFKDTDQKVLRVRTYTTIAAKFLIPRLEDFKSRHPDIDVQLTVGVTDIDFTKDRVDLGIQFGDGRWPDLHADFLFDDEIEPVCAPRLLSDRHGAPTDAKSLLGRCLLVSHYRRSDWDDWLAASKLTEAATGAERMVFSSSVLTWQAALDGLGVAIGQTALLSAELATGQLVRPFRMPLRRDMAHYLVRPKVAREKRKVRVFRDWIVGTMKGGLAR